jgi:predicted nucleic acid-binding protein
VLYLDSSAALKLVREETESGDLARFLEGGENALATSRIGIVELRRIARRGGASPDRADALAGSLEIIELDSTVEGIAVTLAPELRALDAIHLASALTSRDHLHGFVCYDRRLGEAAAREGLPVIAPGAEP